MDVLADTSAHAACLHTPYPRGQSLDAEDEMDLDPNRSFKPSGS
jgi:hypothetical protein